HGERRELGSGGVDAERAAGDLVLAQGLPGAADRQPSQTGGDRGGEQGQCEDQVVEKDRPVDRTELESEPGGETLIAGVERNAEKARPRNPGDARITVSHRHTIDQYQPDDLPEGKGNNGDIVA